MEQRPELRYALHVGPTAVSVAAERTYCMRCFHFTQRQVEVNRVVRDTTTSSIPGRLSCLLLDPSKAQSAQTRTGGEEDVF